MVCAYIKITLHLCLDPDSDENEDDVVTLVQYHMVDVGEQLEVEEEEAELELGEEEEEEEVVVEDVNKVGHLGRQLQLLYLLALSPNKLVRK